MRPPQAGHLLGRVLRIASAFLLAGLLMSAGCALVPSAIIAASAVGVEYSITNVAYRVLPVEALAVRDAVDRAVGHLTLRVEMPWRFKGGEDVLVVVSLKHRVEIGVERVAPSATRVRVDARRKDFGLIKDKALAAAVILETEKELDQGAGRRAER